MSITSVRSYFRARALSVGWKEWKDPFDPENIPNTVLDNGFQLSPASVGASRQNQLDLELPITQTVRFFKQGYRDVASGMDSSEASCESFIKSSLKASNRLTGAGLKNVQLTGLTFEQLGNNNDLIRATMTFNCLVILETET